MKMSTIVEHEKSFITSGPGVQGSKQEDTKVVSHARNGRTFAK